MTTTQATPPVLHGPTVLAGRTPADVIGATDTGARLAAARSAGAHAYVSELPEGYHTPVGAGGVQLTASQRLRLDIAGLLAADPPSIVLDQPTAGLDRASEAAVLPGLVSLCRGRKVDVVDASATVRAAAAAAAAAAATAATAGANGITLDWRPGPPPPPPDPALPALPLLLDPAAMAGMLGENLGSALAPDVRVHSVRYKPGDNVVVQYDVLTPSGWVGAVVYARSRGRLKKKSETSANRKLARRAADRAPAPWPIGYLPDVEALLQWMPLDVRLPVLADDAERLSRRLAKKHIHADVSTPVLLRYWPRRRAVLRFGPYVLKQYRDRGDFVQSLRALRAADSLERIRTAPYVGRFPAQQVTIQQWLPGGAPSLIPGSSEPAGRVLADLHAEHVNDLRATTPGDLLRKASSRGRFVAELLPEVAPDVIALLKELRARMPDEDPTVVSHGNFHAGQLLADDSGLAVVDVDRLCRAAPAFDIASLATHLAFGRSEDVDVVDAAIDSLLAGYGRAPSDLGWYVATCLLRRAAVPFRFQDEHWPSATAELVRQARESIR